VPHEDEPSHSDPHAADRRELEAARAALYRQGADDATRRAYADLAGRLGPKDPVGAATAEAARRPRRGAVLVTAASLVAAASLVLGMLLLPRSATVRMTPLRLVGATDPAAEEAAVLSLFAGSFAAQNQLALRAVVDQPPALADGGVQKATVERIAGTVTVAAAQSATGGNLTVVVLCTTATAYRWVLTANEGGRRRVLADASARACLGTAAYATVGADGSHSAVLRFTATRGERALVALVATP
jgi:hypothetical protein